MVFTYIVSCIVVQTRPCKYFQLNASWFNQKKGVFSKLDLNSLFPEKWRLDIDILDFQLQPTQYPVWLKPEWGENASGVLCARNHDEFQKFKDKILKSKRCYLVQRSATGCREFELFTVWESPDSSDPAAFSMTEVKNQNNLCPVNGIYNQQTSYHDLTAELQSNQASAILKSIKSLGRFPLSRLCIRANSIEDVVNGQFQIIEINLFTPMPIHILDARYTNRERLSMILKMMRSLAKATRNRDQTHAEKSVYLQMTYYRIRNLLTALGK